ncbi:winged helix-turn-helix domain-containing protein, partial [[Clostridium] innocuum]|nr:winged helix-turn-helix domain-containing protein [[Clostridium] innocuum]
RYDFIRENHEKEINFSFKFVSQEGKDKKKPHFKGLNLHFEFFIMKNTLLNRIDNGELLPGERLESERDLAEKYGVNRQTVRSALNV